MDEDVYGRIAPKKPRLWSFHEEQEELRNLTRDRKKRYQPQHKVKKPYAQVHVTAEGGASLKTERTRQPSELSALTEIVKKVSTRPAETDGQIVLAGVKNDRYTWCPLN